MTIREVAIVHMHQTDSDKHMFDYNGRMIHICPRPYKEDNIPVEVVYVNLIGDLVIDRGDVYLHVLKHGDQAGYSKVMKGPFKIGFEDLKKRFYFHYLKKEGINSWRCPTDDVELVWEHAEPMPYKLQSN